MAVPEENLGHRAKTWCWRENPDFHQISPEKGFRNVWIGDMFTIILVKYIYFAIAISVVKLLWNTCVPFNESKTLRRRKLCFKQFCINEPGNERSDISAIYKAIMSPSWPFLSICFQMKQIIDNDNWDEQWILEICHFCHN